MATTQPSTLDQVEAWFKNAFAKAEAELGVLLKEAPADLAMLEKLLSTVGAVLTVIPGLNVGGYLLDIETWVQMAENLVKTIDGIFMPEAEAINIGVQYVKATGDEAKGFVRSRAKAKYSAAGVADFIHDTFIQDTLAEVRKPAVVAHLAFMARKKMQAEAPAKAKS